MRLHRKFQQRLLVTEGAFTHMKKNTSHKTIYLAALSVTLLLGSTLSHAQPGAPVVAGKKAPKKSPALKHAEEVLGKPLTPAQKTAVRAAAKERATAMKRIMEKYRTTVAKALGMTLAQYEAKEKSLKARNKKTP